MLFYEVANMSLHKHGEELCGDTVKISKYPGRTIVVLSDGLGSGVKANILSTLTSEIVNTMLSNGVSIQEVLDTMVATLPVCKVRKMAYATFSILDINERKNIYRVINSDSPAIFHMRDGKVIENKTSAIKVRDKELTLQEGEIHEGDFLAMISDGILCAGLGGKLNFGWRWEQVSEFLESVHNPKMSAQDVTEKIIEQTRILYDDYIGDDATFVGVNVRQRRKLALFTGPPINKDDDDKYCREFLAFNGIKIVCGGTTANILANYSNTYVETDVSTMTQDCPPVGKMEGIDLVTEGIVTISKVMDFFKNYHGRYENIIETNDGINRLVRYLINADHIHIWVGQTINPFYQNPLLPKNVSIRLNLMRELANFLKSLHKDVVLKLC
ncbi:MAG: SpoIIE family protein phosphatase [Candidatus Omnitrophica bacterium]|nr:SpoIIE family protein phosphatase [Candidatus Omnitrophota bacterium]MDD5441360.1 SpoIIE family protein phosphatase [Candidatus Omnitrophota bacterium]